MRVLSLSGSASAMGEAFGEICRDEIAQLYALRLENALEQARRFGARHASEPDLLALARACLGPSEAYDPVGMAELRGIARGARLEPERVLAMNGLTDLRDALAWGGVLEAVGGCTSFVLQRDRSSDGRIWCGQTWDLATDNRPFVLGVHRRPAQGPETWCVTTVGCLSLMGLNAEGIAVGTTNLRTLDARPGAPYLNLIHRALASRDHAEAVASILEAPRAGAHSYYVVDSQGRAATLECTAREARAREVSRGIHVQCNHCLLPEFAALEASTPRASSEARQRRMEQLLAAGPHDLRSLCACLADREGGELAIQRDDFEGISTNAALVMSPEAPAAWACQGLPETAPWIDLLASRT